VNTDGIIRILLADDSAVVRGALRQIIETAPDLRVVATAPNGKRALGTLELHEVDVVLLDIEMPEMDGLATLPLILQRFPRVRVIMASSLTQQGATITMQALALGAVDYISKPTARAGPAALAGLHHEIIEKIRAIGGAAHRARLRGLQPVKRTIPLAAAPVPRITVLGGHGDTTPRVIAIASSTGGPNALVQVLKQIPRDFPLPILITQHMPPLFTTLLAQRLQRESGRPCAEAADGAPILGGHTYLAPGDKHFLVQTREGRPFVKLSDAPPENHCRPAADPMLRSIAAAYGASTVTVVLTGMGEDGRRGCEAVRQHGGRIIAQDEATSVVWGMPGAVTNAGLAEWVLPLGEIAQKLSTLCLVHA
jgi:two-component system chemotaxis response regulator CheB